MTHQLLTDYAAYNHWANRAIVGWLQSKPADMLERETKSSFPNLRDTLLHIWSAQKIWLNRLKGDTEVPYLPDVFQGNPQELFDGLIDSSREFEVFLLAQEQDYPDQRTGYFQRSQGKNYEHANMEIVLHCLQHSTFHRGQIVTMGRSLGLSDPPQTDYIAYVRLRDAGLAG